MTERKTSVILQIEHLEIQVDSDIKGKGTRGRGKVSRFSSAETVKEGE